MLDIASGIYSIRQNPPTKTRRMEIWSDGTIYPVVVIPVGVETRQMKGGKKIEVRHFSIRGIDVPDRGKWKGKLDLWLARDERGDAGRDRALPQSRRRASGADDVAVAGSLSRRRYA